jgi:hypothetical protein
MSPSPPIITVPFSHYISLRCSASHYGDYDIISEDDPFFFICKHLDSKEDFHHLEPLKAHKGLYQLWFKPTWCRSIERYVVSKEDSDKDRSERWRKQEENTARILATKERYDVLLATLTSAIEIGLSGKIDKDVCIKQAKMIIISRWTVLAKGLGVVTPLLNANELNLIKPLLDQENKR